MGAGSIRGPAANMQIEVSMHVCEPNTLWFAVFMCLCVLQKEPHPSQSLTHTRAHTHTALPQILKTVVCDRQEQGGEGFIRGMDINV